MKAVTLWQPWASLIALGVKAIETRSWRAPAALIGERIAIHAAARLPERHDIGGYRPAQSRVPGAAWHLWFHRRGTAETGGVGGRTCVPLPLGAVVATARLVECLPMVDAARQAGENASAMLRFLGGRLIIVRHRVGGYTDTDVTDQRPYGDFAPGRWAWMLDEIEALDEPIPARGGQRIWNWNAS